VPPFGHQRDSVAPVHIKYEDPLQARWRAVSGRHSLVIEREGVRGLPGGALQGDLRKGGGGEQGPDRDHQVLVTGIYMPSHQLESPIRPKCEGERARSHALRGMCRP
jgi:hypothetical protein